MKKVFFMAAVLLVSAFGFAQKVKVVGLSGLEVQFKRCIVNGSEGYIDFLFTNVSSYDMCQLWFHQECLFGMTNYKPQLFDDEGNMLTQWEGLNAYNIIIGNQKHDANIAKDVPVKVRVPFTNVDEYATEFTFLTLPVNFKQGNQSANGFVEVRNIPIVRREQ